MITARNHRTGLFHDSKRYFLINAFDEVEEERNRKMCPKVPKTQGKLGTYDTTLPFLNSLLIFLLETSSAQVSNEK